MEENTVVTQELTNTATEAVAEVAKNKTLVGEVGEFVAYGAGVAVGSAVVYGAGVGLMKLAKWVKGKISDRRARKKAAKAEKEQKESN